MLALCSMLLHTYYAHFSADIIGAALLEKTKWNEFMGKEINSLKNNKVWKLTTLPPEKKAIGCKWVYKVKSNSNGSVKYCYKARLVARGFNQKVWFRLQRNLLSHYEIGVAEDPDSPVYAMWIGTPSHTAFLNGTLQEEVYIISQRDMKKKEKNSWCSVWRRAFMDSNSPPGARTQHLTPTQKNGIYIVEVWSLLCLQVRRIRPLLHWSVCWWHDSDRKGWNHDEQSQATTVI